MNPLSTRTTRSCVGVVGALVLLAGLAACGSTNTASPTPATTPSSNAGASTPAAGPGAAASGTLSAADESGDGTTLSVANVDLEGVTGGWVAVHTDLNGRPGPVVGVVQVKKGTTTNLKVTLDKKVRTGAYWSMLHVDDHTLGTYEFPKTAGADLPVKSGTDIVMKKITLTVA